MSAKPTAREFWDGVFTAGYPFSRLSDAALDGVLAKVESRVGYCLRDAADVGAGTGGLTVALAKRGLCVTAFDISPVALAALTRAAMDANVDASVATREANLNASSFGDDRTGAFDIVFSKLSIAFARDKSQAIARLSAMLRPCGALVVLTPVLGEQFVYDAQQRGMSVERESFEANLRRRFGHVDIASEEGDPSWPLVTYICTKSGMGNHE